MTQKSLVCLVALAAALVGCSSGSGGADRSAPAEETPAAAPPPEDTAIPKETRAPLHGGVVFTAAEQSFESVLGPDGIRVYRYTAAGLPAFMKPASGSATLRLPDGTSREVALVLASPAEGEAGIFYCPGHERATQRTPGICKDCGTMQLFAHDWLAAKTDLSGIDPAGIEVSFVLKGLDSAEKDVTFAQKLAPAAGAHGG